MLNLLLSWINKRKNYFVLFLLLSLSLFLLSLNRSEKLNVLRKNAFVAYAFFAYNASKVYDYLFSNSEVIELKKEIARLTLQNNLYKEYSYQNRELLKAIELRSELDYDLISVRISSKNVDKFQTSFLISSYAEDSLSIGMPVVGTYGLIGFIIDVFNNSALVKTYQSKDFKVALRNQRTRIDGIAEWNGKNLIIKNIPLSYDVKEGDLYSTSEYSSIMPAALPVALVKKIELDRAGVMHVAILEPLENLSKSEFAFVVKARKTLNILFQNINSEEKK